MGNLRETYVDISRYYLREARSCIESKSYRMAIVSAATSIHLATYFILLSDGKYEQDKKVAKFYNVLQKIKKAGEWKKSEDDIEWLMNARNAVAHPQEWIITETETDNTGKITFTIKEKNKECPLVKKQVFTSSMTNDLQSLSKLAKESVKKAEQVLVHFGIPVELDSVKGRKEHEEKIIFECIGKT